VDSPSVLTSAPPGYCVLERARARTGKASTPPGYCVLERARARTVKATTNLKTNHGGICVFIKSELQVKVIDFLTYKSVELLTLFVRFGALSFVFVVVYRPDPSSDVTNSFLVDWVDVLERTSAFAGCVIVGDVNLHVYEVTNPSSIRFHTLPYRPTNTRRQPARYLCLSLRPTSASCQG